MNLHELANQLGLPYEGDGTWLIQSPASLEKATPEQISFIENERYYSFLKTTQAGVIIAKAGVSIPCGNIIRTPTPRLIFAQVLNLFYRARLPKPGIHPTAVLGTGVRLGERVHLGAHVVLGEGTTIGDDVVIFPNTTVYNHVIIGDRSIIHSNCSINDYTQIGQDCFIQQGVAIGGEGFGFVPTPEGTWYKMPQTGWVVLEDKVEIGCNSTVDRASLGETRIGKGTKIDNLVQISHGCTIGPHCVLASGTGIGGGTTIEEHVTIGAQVGIKEHVTIGKGVMMAARTGIHSNVAAGSIIAGHPEVPLRVWAKYSAAFKYLPEMQKNVRALKKQVAVLEARINSNESMDSAQSKV
jgi:UDP-3-O-[3-hydroxymyristoyl] glucosamine N-acyltransferase